jgi:UDP-N-acetylglucosamine--N-acetylmuramyl-(pentapeptide) pyrophosphoryl-undecaprenol N-acetylglucosamine transferase
VAQLSIRHADAEVRWVGGRRGLESKIVPKADLPLHRLWLRSLRSVDVSLSTLTDPIRLAASVPQAVVMLLRWRPDVIYSTGGYVAIPILIAAAMLRIPSLLWEGNSLPGRSVRSTARLARLRAVSYAATRARLPAPAYLTGTPIRQLSGIARAASRARLGLAVDLPVLLIFGGSQAVRRLNDAVAEALPDLVARCSVLHITGAGAFAEAEALGRTLPEAVRDRYRPFVFLDEDMEVALVASDLLVGRAGSSSLAEAAAVGLPMIVVPYPHAAAHQSANAAEMVEAGGATLVDDADLDGDTLRTACDLLFDDALGRMAEAARTLGRPGAARATAHLLEALAERRSLPRPDEVEAITREAA